MFNPDRALARLYESHPGRFDSGLDLKLLLFAAHAAMLSRLEPSHDLRPAYDYLRRVSVGEINHESAPRERLEAIMLARADFDRIMRQHDWRRPHYSALALAALGAKADPTNWRPGRHNGVVRYLVGLIVAQYGKSSRAVINARLGELFDDLFGDFEAGPDLFRPEWRTTEVLGLASAVRAGRFDVLPILADALEEAGCDHTNLLSHCRAGGPHFVGCRALDFLDRHD